MYKNGFRSSSFFWLRSIASIVVVCFIVTQLDLAWAQRPLDAPGLDDAPSDSDAERKLATRSSETKSTSGYITNIEEFFIEAQKVKYKELLSQFRQKLEQRQQEEKVDYTVTAQLQKNQHERMEVYRELGMVSQRTQASISQIAAIALPFHYTPNKDDGSVTWFKNNLPYKVIGQRLQGGMYKDIYEMQYDERKLLKSLKWRIVTKDGKVLREGEQTNIQWKPDSVFYSTHKTNATKTMLGYDETVAQVQSGVKEAIAYEVYTTDAKGRATSYAMTVRNSTKPNELIRQVFTNVTYYADASGDSVSSYSLKERHLSVDEKGNLLFDPVCRCPLLDYTVSYERKNIQYVQRLDKWLANNYEEVMIDQYGRQIETTYDAHYSNEALLQYECTRTRTLRKDAQGKTLVETEETHIKDNIAYDASQVYTIGYSFKTIDKHGKISEGIWDATADGKFLKQMRERQTQAPYIIQKAAAGQYPDLTWTGYVWGNALTKNKDNEERIENPQAILDYGIEVVKDGQDIHYYRLVLNEAGTYDKKDIKNYTVEIEQDASGKIIALWRRYEIQERNSWVAKRESIQINPQETIRVTLEKKDYASLPAELKREQTLYLGYARKIEIIKEYEAGKTKTDIQYVPLYDEEVMWKGENQYVKRVWSAKDNKYQEIALSRYHIESQDDAGICTWYRVYTSNGNTYKEEIYNTKGSDALSREYGYNAQGQLLGYRQWIQTSDKEGNRTGTRLEDFYHMTYDSQNRATGMSGQIIEQGKTQYLEEYGNAYNALGQRIDGYRYSSDTEGRSFSEHKYHVRYDGRGSEVEYEIDSTTDNARQHIKRSNMQYNEAAQLIEYYEENSNPLDSPVMGQAATQLHRYDMQYTLKGDLVSYKEEGSYQRNPYVMFQPEDTANLKRTVPNTGFGTYTLIWTGEYDAEGNLVKAVTKRHDEQNQYEGLPKTFPADHPFFFKRVSGSGFSISPSDTVIVEGYTYEKGRRVKTLRNFTQTQTQIYTEMIRVKYYKPTWFGGKEKRYKWLWVKVQQTWTFQTIDEVNYRYDASGNVVGYTNQHEEKVQFAKPSLLAMQQWKPSFSWFSNIFIYVLGPFGVLINSMIQSDTMKAFLSSTKQLIGQISLAWTYQTISRTEVSYILDKDGRIIDLSRKDTKTLDDGQTGITFTDASYFYDFITGEVIFMNSKKRELLENEKGDLLVDRTTSLGRTYTAYDPLTHQALRWTDIIYDKWGGYLVLRLDTQFNEQGQEVADREMTHQLVQGKILTIEVTREKKYDAKGRVSFYRTWMKKTHRIPGGESQEFESEDAVSYYENGPFMNMTCAYEERARNITLKYDWEKSKAKEIRYNALSMRSSVALQSYDSQGRPLWVRWFYFYNDDGQLVKQCSEVVEEIITKASGLGAHQSIQKYHTEVIFHYKGRDLVETETYTYFENKSGHGALGSTSSGYRYRKTSIDVWGESHVIEEYEYTKTSQGFFGTLIGQIVKGIITFIVSVIGAICAPFTGGLSVLLAAAVVFIFHCVTSYLSTGMLSWESVGLYACIGIVGVLLPYGLTGLADGLLSLSNILLASVERLMDFINNALMQGGIGVFASFLYVAIPLMYSVGILCSFLGIVFSYMADGLKYAKEGLDYVIGTIASISVTGVGLIDTLLAGLVTLPLTLLNGLLSALIGSEAFSLANPTLLQEMQAIEAGALRESLDVNLYVGIYLVNNFISKLLGEFLNEIIVRILAGWDMTESVWFMTKRTRETTLTPEEREERIRKQEQGFGWIAYFGGIVVSNVSVSLVYNPCIYSLVTKISTLSDRFVAFFELRWFKELSVILINASMSATVEYMIVVWKNAQLKENRAQRRYVRTASDEEKKRKASLFEYYAQHPIEEAEFWIPDFVNVLAGFGAGNMAQYVNHLYGLLGTFYLDPVTEEYEIILILSDPQNPGQTIQDKIDYVHYRMRKIAGTVIYYHLSDPNKQPLRYDTEKKELIVSRFNPSLRGTEVIVLRVHGLQQEDRSLYTAHEIVRRKLYNASGKLMREWGYYPGGQMLRYQGLPHFFADSLQNEMHQVESDTNKDTKYGIELVLEKGEEHTARTYFTKIRQEGSSASLAAQIRAYAQQGQPIVVGDDFLPTQQDIEHVDNHLRVARVNVNLCLGKGVKENIYGAGEIVYRIKNNRRQIVRILFEGKGYIDYQKNKAYIEKKIPVAGGKMQTAILTFTREKGIWKLQTRSVKEDVQGVLDLKSGEYIRVQHYLTPRNKALQMLYDQEETRTSDTGELLETRYYASEQLLAIRDYKAHSVRIREYQEGTFFNPRDGQMQSYVCSDVIVGLKAVRISRVYYNQEEEVIGVDEIETDASSGKSRLTRKIYAPAYNPAQVSRDSVYSHRLQHAYQKLIRGHGAELERPMEQLYGQCREVGVYRFEGEIANIYTWDLAHDLHNAFVCQRQYLQLCGIIAWKPQADVPKMVPEGNRVTALFDPFARPHPQNSVSLQSTSLPQWQDKVFLQGDIVHYEADFDDLQLYRPEQMQLPQGSEDFVMPQQMQRQRLFQAPTSMVRPPVVNIPGVPKPLN